jgi:hypothetical protein
MADNTAAPVKATIAGEAMRPPSPVRLSARLDSSGDIHCSWVRRSSKAWSWLDNVDAPLGCSTEIYRATLSGPNASIERTSSESQVEFTAAEIATLGMGVAKLSVVQVGDLAVSRPANLSITINQE